MVLIFAGDRLSPLHVFDMIFPPRILNFLQYVLHFFSLGRHKVCPYICKNRCRFYYVIKINIIFIENFNFPHIRSFWFITTMIFPPRVINVRCKTRIKATNKANICPAGRSAGSKGRALRGDCKRGEIPFEEIRGVCKGVKPL